MQKNSLHFNNGKINYQTAGMGEPIVFVHGFGLDLRMWEQQVEYFSDDHQVVIYDARGFGKSSTPTTPYNHADDLTALFDHLDINQAHIVGLSMGGRIAVNMALNYPDRVQSLVCMDAALDGYDNEVDWDVHAKEQGIAQAKENWLNHEVFANAQQQPQTATALRSIVEDYSGWHWLNTDTQVLRPPLARTRLREIAQPALIMVGENDLPYFHKIADVLEEDIQGAQKVIIPDAGHMVNMEQPDKVNPILAGFINTNKR